MKLTMLLFQFDHSTLEGKAVLVVNVASECGYTHTHYTQLQQLYEELQHTQSFEIIGKLVCLLLQVRLGKVILGWEAQEPPSPLFSIILKIKG